jgi:hypothetical protein
MKSLARFLAHLSEVEGRFECAPAGNAKMNKREIRVRHEIGAAATASHLEQLRKLLGEHAAEVEALYSKHDGLELYGQSGGGELIFFPINQWEKATRGFRRELQESGRDADGAYEFELNGVVFGEPASSGNYLMLYQGAVYYADHDGGDDTPLAPCFEALLDRIVEDPAKFLNDLGCHARYSDGSSDTQWVPERYISGARAR